MEGLKLRMDNLFEGVKVLGKMMNDVVVEVKHEKKILRKRRKIFHMIPHSENFV